MKTRRTKTCVLLKDTCEGSGQPAIDVIIKGECPVCAERVGVNKNGSTRKHNRLVGIRTHRETEFTTVNPDRSFS